MALLTGSVMLVTGGGRGIGEAICVEPATQGAAVTVADLDPRRAADIAPAVAFLLPPGAAYIIGQTLSVSGGLTMA